MRNIIAGAFLLCFGATAGFGNTLPESDRPEVQDESASLIVLPVIWETVRNIHYFASWESGVFADDVIYTDLNLNRSFHFGDRDLRGVRFFMADPGTS